jgi:phosphoribosylamine-glycine ligase
MSKPFGVTIEYRKSDEYKHLVNCVKNDYPDMPLYLIEVALTVHKNDPQFYKAAIKSERMSLAKTACGRQASVAGVQKSLVDGVKLAQHKIDDYILNTVTVSDPITEADENNISDQSNNDYQTEENLQNSDTQPEQTGPRQISV